MLRREPLPLFGHRIARSLATARAPRVEVDQLECLVTLWETRWSARGEELATTWPEMLTVLRERRPWRGASHPGWSAASFAPGLRAPANVRSVAALVIHYAAGPCVTLDRVADVWGTRYGLVQTTSVHSRHAHDAVLILPYARLATLAEHQRIAELAKDTSEREGLPVDPMMRNPARFFFLPGTVPGRPFETRDLSGRVLDPYAACLPSILAT
jgi:hypothetical protein